MMAFLLFFSRRGTRARRFHLSSSSTDVSSIFVGAFPKTLPFVLGFSDGATRVDGRLLRSRFLVFSSTL